MVPSAARTGYSNSPWGRTIPLHTASFAWTWRSTARMLVRLKPVFGYLHRNHEKIAEGASYLASMPYTDRLDYFCSLTNNWAYALAVEKLVGQEVPERAEYIRVILAELTRIQNHAASIGFLIQEMGASGTPLRCTPSRSAKRFSTSSNRSPARA